MSVLLIGELLVLQQNTRFSAGKGDTQKIQKYDSSFEITVQGPSKVTLRTAINTTDKSIHADYYMIMRNRSSANLTLSKRSSNIIGAFYNAAGKRITDIGWIRFPPAAKPAYSSLEDIVTLSPNESIALKCAIGPFTHQPEPGQYTFEGTLYHTPRELFRKDVIDIMKKFNLKLIPLDLRAKTRLVVYFE